LENSEWNMSRFRREKFGMEFGKGLSKKDKRNFPPMILWIWIQES
jgi:hypothetical protein